jgi:hypothetical protein
MNQPLAGLRIEVVQQQALRVSWSFSGKVEQELGKLGS